MPSFSLAALLILLNFANVTSEFNIQYLPSYQPSFQTAPFPRSQGHMVWLRTKYLHVQAADNFTIGSVGTAPLRLTTIPS
jgi:hypothetical protein